MDFSDRDRAEHSGRERRSQAGSTLVERASSLPRALLAALSVGAAFGAGIVAGGIGEAEAAVVAVDAVEADPLARAEARTKAYEQLIKGTQLSWHQELTALEPALPPLPPKKATTTTTTKAAVAAPLAEAATASPMIDKALAVTDPEPTPPPREVAAVDAGSEAASDDRAGESEVVVRPDPKLLDDAMARVLGEKPAAAVVVVDKRYAVQLASTGTEAAAQILAADWNKRGQAAVVVAAEVAGKGTMYRVRIIGIASRAAADALKLKLGQGLVVAD